MLKKHNMSATSFTQRNFAPEIRGFTLIEIMVSVAIFTVIITTGMGSLVTLLRSYELTQNQKQVHNGLNYALETMAREIRLGQDYYAGANGIEVGGNDGTAESLGFRASDGRGYVRYFVDNETLFINRSGAQSAQNAQSALTDNSEVIIDNIRFVVDGTESFAGGDLQQPYVWLQIQARAVDGDENLETTVQTFISQRTLDF